MGIYIRTVKAIQNTAVSESIPVPAEIGSASMLANEPQGYCPEDLII